MLLRSLLLQCAAVCCVVLSIIYQTYADTTKTPGLCQTDADCEKSFPNTVCVEVIADSGSTDNVRKCVPHTTSRTACRGASRGLCPEYQSEEVGYLNPVCTFQSLDDLDASTKKSKKSCSSGDAKESCYFTYEVTADNKTKLVNGTFVCAEIYACPMVSAFPDSCEGSLCVTGKNHMCNDHGTCTLSSYEKTDKQICTCYAGFSGAKCEKTVSGQCDIGCGYGGDCMNGTCVCEKNWDGDNRCTKCSSDDACQNGGTCDKPPLGTGKCICPDGYTGETCGGRVHECVGVDCGKGICQDGVCYCPLCSPTCTKCKDNTCSECPKNGDTYIQPSMIWICLAFGHLLLKELL